jgi:signal transduction histidine kinase
MTNINYGKIQSNKRDINTAVKEKWEKQKIKQLLSVSRWTYFLMIIVYPIHFFFIDTPLGLTAPDPLKSNWFYYRSFMTMLGLFGLLLNTFSDFVIQKPYRIRLILIIIASSCCYLQSLSMTWTPLVPYYWSLLFTTLFATFLRTSILPSIFFALFLIAIQWNSFILAQVPLPLMIGNFVVVISVAILMGSREQIEFELFLEKEDNLENQRKNYEDQMALAKQVSHDIRSPLAALNLVIKQITHLPEQDRLLVRNSVNRITDIANSLLNKSKNQLNEHSQTRNENKPELLYGIIDSIISEKRVEYRNKINVEIEFDFQHSYGAFALINPTEFSRVISNLVNNSVEAFKNET